MSSVIIPVYGDPALLANCLANIGEVDDLILVDNASGNWNCARATVLRNPVNVGFAAACNQGALLAKTDQLVFLNVDTEPQPGWLEALVGMLHNYPICGSKLIYPDGRIQHAGVRFRRGYQIMDNELIAENILTDEPSGEREAVTGACMAVDRATFYELGGFDTDFRNGYEDVDLCLRLRANGHAIWYEQFSVVVHHESATGPERWTHVHDNIRLLQKKHRDYEPAG